jgi:hypothetical protein
MNGRMAHAPKLNKAARGRVFALLELNDRLLVGLVLAAVVFLIAYFAVLKLLPTAWQTPGSPPLYILGIIGAALLLVSMLFVGVKHSGHGGSPPAWLAAHVVAAILGMVLVAVHSTGALKEPPALMFLALLGLSVAGVWARTRVARQMSATFGTRYHNFGAVDAARRERLREIIASKTDLLARLAPHASEGTFSLQAMHWLGKPLLAFPYARLVREENRLIGGRRTLPAIQAYWRWVHIVLGLMFVLGLLCHVVTVTFMADYVAAGQPIIWPHVAW